MQRRDFLALAVSAGAPTRVAGNAGLAAVAQFAELERHSGGRLGVFVLDTSNGRSIAHRDSERFPMCSTFKLLAVAGVLAAVDRGTEQLQRRIAYTRDDLLEYAPVTTQHLAAGSMTVEQLCVAAIEWSDNTAANLLVQSIGGPSGVTGYARSLDDRRTRLDRIEPALNTAVPGDLRDTTTPRDMARDAQRIVLGRALSHNSRARLTAWLTASRTGGKRLRAGVPATWRSVDKTGSGRNGTSNDVALFWPPAGSPIVAAAYLTGSSRTADERDALLADIGRLIVRAFA